MIVPNISFDPEIDDLSSLFTSVFNRVEKQLELYDKVETKFQESLKYNETNKLKAKIYLKFEQILLVLRIKLI